MKVARTVWSGGKSGDNFKGLPIAIGREKSGYEAAHGRRRRGPDRHHAGPFAVWSVQLTAAAAFAAVT